MARDLWLYGGSPTRLLLLLLLHQVFTCKAISPRHPALFFWLFECVYRWLSWFGHGEVALTDPLVHSAETSCALSRRNVVFVAQIPLSRRLNTAFSMPCRLPIVMNTCVIYRQCAISKSTGNSVRGTGLQLWERKPGKVVLRACVIKSQGIDWDCMIGFCASWSSVYVCRRITSHRPSDNSRNCFINTPSRMSVNGETNIEIAII